MTIVDEDAPPVRNGSTDAPTSKDGYGDVTDVDAASGSRDATYESTQLPNSAEPDSELGTRKPHRALADASGAAVQQPTERAPWITFACYFVAFATLTVSLNTSWRFFAEVLHIGTAYGERYVMFAVAEMALVVCGAGMAVNVRRTGQPGSFRLIVWGMCGVSAYMAWAMSNFEEGLARVILGPVLGTIMLHLALGLELRAHHHRTGTFARIAYELRERLLSRLGLADDERDALQRTRDRAAFRAAQLSLPRRWRWSRQARLQRALMAANVADDAHMRDKMLSRLSILRHAHELATHDQFSPWFQEDDELRKARQAEEQQRREAARARAAEEQRRYWLERADAVKEQNPTLKAIAERPVEQIADVLQMAHRGESQRKVHRMTGVRHEAFKKIVEAERRVVTGRHDRAAVATVGDMPAAEVTAARDDID